MAAGLKYALAFIAFSYIMHLAEAETIEIMKSNIRRLYKGFKDFPKAMAYYKRQAEQYRPLVLIVIFDRMTELKLINDIKIAIQLYDKVLDHPNATMPMEYLIRFDEIKNYLLDDVIVPKGAELLASHTNTNVTKIVDWMKMHTGPAANSLLMRYWQTTAASSSDPAKVIAGTSGEVRQNVFLLVSLIKFNLEDAKYSDDLKEQLGALTKHERFESSVSKERRLEVYKIVDKYNYDKPLSLRIGCLKEIVTLYNEDRSNYDKVIELINNKGDAFDKALCAVSFYEVMKTANHSYDPFTTIPIYDQLEKYLRLEKSDDKLKRLIEFMDMLAVGTIVPKSVDFLSDSVVPNQLQTVKLIDLLQNSSEYLTKRVIYDVWIKRNRKYYRDRNFFLAITPLLRQKVFLLVTLYRTDSDILSPIDTVQKDIEAIIHHPLFKKLVPREQRRQIEYLYDLTLYEPSKSIKKYYNESFANFRKVIRYMDNNFGLQRKANIILELYQVMTEHKHAGECVGALTMLDAVNERLDTNPDELLPQQVLDLQKIQSALLTVVKDDGTRALKHAVSDGKSSPEVAKVIDLIIDSGNKTVLDETIGAVFTEKGKSLDTMLKIAAGDEQKVRLTLAIYRLSNITSDIRKDIRNKLSKDAGGVSDTMKAIVQKYLHSWFLQKNMRLFLSKSAESKVYLQACGEENLTACVSETPTDFSTLIAYEILWEKTNRLLIGIKNLNYLWSIQKNISAGSDGLTFNVFAAPVLDLDHSGNYYWSTEVDDTDNTIIWSNESKDSYLCSDGVDKAYSRNKETFEENKDECKWEVEFL